jgi:hypothetical protein
VWDLAKEREWDLEKRFGGVLVFFLFVFGFFFVFSVVAVYQSITKNTFSLCSRTSVHHWE